MFHSCLKQEATRELTVKLTRMNNKTQGCLAFVLLLLCVSNLWQNSFLTSSSTAALSSLSFYDSFAATTTVSNNSNNNEPCPTTTSSSSSSSATSRPRIAIISGFVTRQTGPKAPQVNDYNYDHMINKACYADIWGYDFIFNTSWGFDTNVGNRYWLEYGTWHRVPHMAAALPHYDWIVYTDVDWYVRDLTIPLESFIRDWELHGLHNVSVFLPVDVPGTHVFSAYVVMIRNNAFGRRLIHNWLRFANGMCEKGNFNTTPGRYGWEDSDQPGIWYALPKTHAELYGNQYDAECQDGFVKTGRFNGPEMRQYFLNHGVKFGGNQGKDLYDIPKGTDVHACVVRMSIQFFGHVDNGSHTHFTMMVSFRNASLQINPFYGPKLTMKQKVV